MENRGQYRTLKQVTGKVYTHIRQEQIKCVCVFMAGRREEIQEEINTTGKEIYPTI
jgi:hypothetical protein